MATKSTKKPSAAQLAARKKFAALAKAGAFVKKAARAVKRAANPAPKKRAKNPARVRTTAQHVTRSPRGEFEVYKAGAGQHHNASHQKLGALLGRFPSKAGASEYAHAYANAHNCTVVVVGQ